ncbi:hypothetical protein EDD15DRAFT_2521460 [Pisolithus albus]|nr:hypothetical protein EDD15DRAFT_2521460 [Pisolithus albus]
MASCCNVHGMVGIRNGRAFTYAQGKTFWKHNGFLPLPSGDLTVDFFTFGGDPAPLEDGPYSGIARVIAQTTAGSNVDASDPVLQLFAMDDFVAMPLMAAECDSQMPFPAFITVGRVCHSNLDVDQNRAFDIDVSQYGAAPQHDSHTCIVYQAFVDGEIALYGANGTNLQVQLVRGNAGMAEKTEVIGGFLRSVGRHLVAFFECIRAE